MNAGATTVLSILDKPLNQLTENDISQVTREDCRKYLKEKGMRRPSWNKSQAIQQVMCLKALLEPCDDSGAGSLRKVVVPPRVSVSPGDSAKEPSDDARDPVSLDESVPCGKMEPPKSVQPADSDNKVTHSRNECMKNGSIGQMTIMYCGNVNVYDGVAPDKARGILQLAASPTHLGQHPFEGTTPFLQFPSHLQTESEKDGTFPPSATIYQTMQTVKMIDYPQRHHGKGVSTRDSDVDGQANRKLSLQRYREKRKDRGRLKSKKITGLTSSLEAYLNHLVRTNISKRNSSLSRTSSPSQPGLPQAFVGITVNQPKFSCLQLDLNLKELRWLRIFCLVLFCGCGRGLSLRTDTCI